MSDVLTVYAWEIDFATVEVERGTADSMAECVYALAAEVRRLRERLAAQEPRATRGRLVQERWEARA
jgi:hypothetical protein